jgi:hypothetical protein
MNCNAMLLDESNNFGRQIGIDAINKSGRQKSAVSK